MKIIVKYLLSFSLLFLGHFSYAQYQTDQERKEYANQLFEQKKYVEAEPHMLYFLSQENSTDYSFKYGVCALFTFADKSKAIRFLSFAAKDRNVNPEAFFYLGKAYHLNYLFNDAIKNFEIFKNKSSPKIQKEFLVDMHIAMCKSGKTLMQNLTDLVVKDKISSSYDKFQYSYDFSKIGGRILVYDGFQSKLDQKLDYRSVMYFPEGDQNLVFYSSYGKDGNNGLDIYKVRRLQNGWSEPELLPAHINTPYDDAFAFLHSDGKTFYFCSKGHSSMGGYDIFRSIYDDQTNSFGPPSNMDYKINTPDDDIMYVVDSANNNAFFSSSRASKAGFIDVYNVRVEVFPIQNVIIAGDFENQIDSTDYDAEIQVLDLVTDQVVGIFHPNKERKYTVILPKSGKYKFVVETPKSESIHTGQVEVMPQKELSLLKQEISLVKNNGVEQLVIRNLFDQKVDNESEILAEVMLELSNPEVNLDEFPDDLFLEDLSIDEPEQDQQPIELDEDVDLVALSNELSMEAQNEANEIETKMNASFMVAESKSEQSQLAAKQAQEILSNIDEIDNPIEKQQQAELAKEYHQKSKELNQQAVSALNVANSLKEQHEIKIKEAQESKEIANSIEKAIKDDSHQEALQQLTQLQEKISTIIDQESDVETSKDSKQQQINSLNKKANVHLKNAQEIRKEQDNIQLNIDNAKRELLSTKKKKDKQDIEQRIERFQQELELTDQMAKEEFEKHEQLIAQTKSLTSEVEMLEEVNELVESNSSISFTDQEKQQLQEKVLSPEISSGIDDNELLLADLPNEQTELILENTIEDENLVDASNSETEEISNQNQENSDVAEENTTLSSENESNDNQTLDNQEGSTENNNMLESEDQASISEESKEDQTVDNQESFVENSNIDESDNSNGNQVTEQALFSQKQQEAFNEVVNDLENSESSMYDYSDSFNESISFNSENSIENAQEIENDLEMLMVAKQELASLEYENLNEEKESRKISRQQEIQQKKLAISEMETELSSSFQDIVDSEKTTNDSLFNSIESILTPELLLEEDFLSAKYYNDQAQKQYDKANILKQQAAATNDVQEKAQLLKEAHQNELAAIENQQDALNLLDDVELPVNDVAVNSTEITSNPNENLIQENELDKFESDNNSENQENRLLEETETTDQPMDVVSEDSDQPTISSSNTNEETDNQVDVSDNQPQKESIQADVLETSEQEDLRETEDVEQQSELPNNQSETQANSTNVEETINQEEITATEDLIEQSEPNTNQSIEEQNNSSDAEELTQQEFTASDEAPEKQLEQPEIQNLDNDNIVKEEKVINQTIAGEEFSSNQQPEVYKVAAVVIEQKQPEVDNFSTTSSKELMSNNLAEIDEVVDYNKELDNLNQQLNTTENDKEVKKIQKKISTLEAKKLDKELKLAEVYELANNNEISISKSKLEVVKKQSNALVNDSYEFNQATAYEVAADELLSQAEQYRKEAKIEKDLTKKNELLKKAASSEVVAVEKIETAKKLYSEALIEDVSLSSSIQPEKPTTSISSEELSKNASDFSDNAQQKLIKSQDLRFQAEKAKSAERSALLFEADKLEALAKEEKLLAQQLLAKSEKVKAYEDYQREKLQLAENLNSVDVQKTASKDEYKNYYNQQKEINELSNQLKAVEQEANAYDELFKQQTIKANSFFNKALEEEDQQKRNEYINTAKQLKQQAMENKQTSDEIKAEAITLSNEVKKKKVAQAQVISSLDNKTANDIKSLALAQNNNTPASISIEPKEVVSTAFTAPTVIEKDIFIVNETTTYSESNPIPVNPPHPEGLIYKVQVGAFRRPIPQDLFTGFAPISAEKVRDDITRYRVGYFKNERNANSSKNTIRGLGYSDAFVVAIYNGERISLTEARNLIENNPSIARASVSEPLSPTSITQTSNENNSNTSSVNEPSQQEDVVAITQSSENQDLNETENANTSNSEYIEAMDNTSAEVNPVETIDGLFYSVQIGAFSKPLDKENAFNVSPLVTQYKNNLYKYSTGIFNSVDEAKVRKDQMNELGLSDAFIVAFYNGERVTIARSLELSANLNPVKESLEDNGVTVLPTNLGREFYVNLGVFGDSVPKSVSNALLSMKEFRIKPKSIGQFRQYISGVFSTKEKAIEAQQKFKQLGIKDAEVVEFENGAMLKGTPKPFNGLFYRVHLGTYYEKVPRKLKDVFVRLDYLDVEKVSSKDQEDYYASNKQLYSQIEQVLKDCVDNGVVVAKIVAFKDGKEIAIDLAKQLTRE